MKNLINENSFGQAQEKAVEENNKIFKTYGSENSKPIKAEWVCGSDLKTLKLFDQKSKDKRLQISDGEIEDQSMGLTPSNLHP